MARHINTRLQRLEQSRGGRVGFLRLFGTEPEATAKHRYLSDHNLAESDIRAWFILEN